MLFIDKNGEILMRWNEESENLYISNKLIVPLKVFSFEEEELNKLVIYNFQ